MRLKYLILCNTYSWQWLVNKTTNILCNVCFDNTDTLPGDDDDDIADISTCDMQATDDEVGEIFRKPII